MEYKNDKTANRRRYKSRYHSPHNYKAKSPGNGTRAPILIGVATFLVLASLVLIFTFGDSIYTFLDNVLHPTLKPEEATLGVVIATEPALPSEAEPEPMTEAPTQNPSVTPSEGASEASAVQSNEFNRLLAAAGLKAESLTNSQMIFVESAGTSAKVYTYEKGTDGIWKPKFDTIAGFVGTGGKAATVGPEDDTTPIGTYAIEYAMGTNADPGTALDYTMIYDGLQWVTDPASQNYNRLVDLDTPVDYSTSQDLSIYTRSYPYAVVFNYNRDPVNPALGCARFLHVAEGPTYGGVGIAENSLQEILLWLTPEANPTISIF